MNSKRSLHIINIQKFVQQLVQLCSNSADCTTSEDDTVLIWLITLKLNYIQMRVRDVFIGEEVNHFCCNIILTWTHMFRSLPPPSTFNFTTFLVGDDSVSIQPSDIMMV